MIKKTAEIMARKCQESAKTDRERDRERERERYTNCITLDLPPL